MAYAYNPFTDEFDYFRKFSEITPEDINGSDLTGSDGDTDRTYETTDGVGLVWVDNQVLHLTKDYTVSGNTITFINKIWDTQTISIWQ